MTNDEFHIAKDIAELITSKYNQHDTLMLLGPKGSGKSWAALRLAYDVSCEVALIKGGKPEDYFTIENVAIITKDEVIRVLKDKLGQYCIVIFDDIGVGWGAREFATKFNKIMNNIYQTFRTRNVFLIVTIPDPQLIDAVPRFMLHYFAEVVESHFDFGFVEVKIKESVRLSQMKKNIYPYIQKNGIKYPRHIISTAPDFLTKPYEEARIRIEKENSDKSIAELEAMTVGDAEKQSNKKCDILRPGIFALHEEGMTQEIIAQKIGCSQKTVSNVLCGKY